MRGRALARQVADSFGKPADWVEEHADYLFNYACSRVYDANLAEDLVQETFLAAVRDQSRFSGNSTVRTWLVGILRDRIFDHFRSVAPEGRQSLETFYLDQLPLRFNADGHWRESEPTTPSAWPPQQQARLEDRGFREQFERCLRRLPSRVRDVFVLREMEELSTDEICRLLDIPRHNVWSVLHRARMALRDCLETHWFGVEVAPRLGISQSAPIEGSS